MQSANLNKLGAFYLYSHLIQLTYASAHQRYLSQFSGFAQYLAFNQSGTCL